VKTNTKCKTKATLPGLGVATRAASVIDAAAVDDDEEEEESDVDDDDIDEREDDDEEDIEESAWAIWVGCSCAVIGCKVDGAHMNWDSACCNSLLLHKGLSAGVQWRVR
jgi:hypothetical protein